MHSGLPAVLGCRLLVGAGSASSMTGSGAMMADLTDAAPQHRAQIMALQSFVLSGVVSVAAGARILSLRPFQSSFASVTVLLLRRTECNPCHDCTVGRRPDLRRAARPILGCAKFLLYRGCGRRYLLLRLRSTARDVTCCGLDCCSIDHRIDLYRRRRRRLYRRR